MHSQSRNIHLLQQYCHFSKYPVEICTTYSDIAVKIANYACMTDIFSR